MTKWQPAQLAKLPTEQRDLLKDVNEALGNLSHDNDLNGPVLPAPATDGQVRLILGPTAEGDRRSPEQLAVEAARRLADSGLRLTVDVQRLAEGYAVRVARRTGRPEVGKPVMIRFPEDMLAQVDARAAETRTSRAAVIRDLVAAGLDTRGTERTMNTITDADIRTAVTAALSEHAAEHDVDGIVRGIIDRYGRIDIETIDHNEFWALVEQHGR